MNFPNLHINQSVIEINSLFSTSVVSRSEMVRSAAMNDDSQPDYCNAVVMARTELTANTLLRQLHGLEAAHGRQRAVHWGARTLDIDVILFGGLHMDDGEIALPHPGLMERSFVLQPLAEIAPDLVLPNGETAMRAASAFPLLRRW